MRISPLLGLVVAIVVALVNTLLTHHYSIKLVTINNVVDMVIHEGVTPHKLPLCRPKADKQALGSRNLRTRGDHSEVKVTQTSFIKFLLWFFICFRLLGQVWT
jgi:hypothetical protein